MTKLTAKTLFRTIRATFGRYMAILAIVALGVGFFTGLKSAQPSMQTTADSYLDAQKMFDFQLMSSLGFSDEDVNAFGNIDGITEAEGGRRLDILAKGENGEATVYQVFSLPEKVALPKLIEGRIPKAKNECLADAAVFSTGDIGSKIVVSEKNNADTLEQLPQKEYTIVGLAQSPRFISYDRGSTSLGNGKITGFLYVLPDAFHTEIYHEALLIGAEDTLIFSDDYDNRIAQLTPYVKEVLLKRATLRHEEIKSNAEQEISKAKSELAAGREEYNRAIASGIPADLLADSLSKLEAAKKEIEKAQTALSEMKEPKTYLLDLGSNPGCASFQNDIVIMNGIANAFPAFFVLIAALVCITTMTRMVNDERTQIGTLKAIGYSDMTISLKYILYASSAALIGCVAGFFIGTSVIPQIIWAVYGMSYGFSALIYYFSPLMYSCCLAVSVIGSVAVTLFACHRELNGKPAELVRPKAPCSGKRIFLERIKPLWNRLSFLNKVTIRNGFRYKRRMIMMLLGIGGCTALIVTGFGLRDSVANILDYQYDEIMLYDASVSFQTGGQAQAEIEALLSERAQTFTFGYQDTLTIHSKQAEKEATVIAVSAKEADRYFGLHDGNKNISYPDKAEAVISSKLADKISVKVGDTITMTFGEKTVVYTIVGICDNFLNHYVYISPESIPDYSSNVAYILQQDNSSEINRTAAELRSVDGVEYVTITSEERALTEKSMSAMNYIVILVILFAGALSFVVLYNLTNINIIERIREVATVKVLGFQSGETASYVLRENLMLSVLGGLLGLGLGRLLHWYVMLQVQVDAMTFDVRISFFSYMLSFLCAIVFTLIANLLMRFKLEKVNMAESLKSVE